MQNPVLYLEEHKHDNHSHIKLSVGETHTEKSGLKISDEGCPCCAAGIDLDELATALSEIGKEGTGNNSGAIEDHGHTLAGELADFSSSAQWGIFLGISGPLSVIGLTAAIRNVKGTINTRAKLKHVIKGLEKDIEKYRTENNKSVVERLEAFKRCLEHSRFDTDFNLIVPGIINGVSSGIVLSSAIWHSPWALPVIGLYSACQTGRNVYELTRTWNRILPESLAIMPLETAGIKKVNQITESKRKFYGANSLGFLTFTVGAIILFLSVIGVIPGLGALIAGIVLLVAGSLATGIMNNIWTNKFKPRNGDLGVDRKQLNCPHALEEIGKRREVKKILKEYRKKHIPYSVGDNIKRFDYKLLTSLPFCEQKGPRLLHKLNTSKCNARNYLPSGTLTRERLELLESIVQVTMPNFQFDKDASDLVKAFTALKELKLEGVILEKFVKNYILKTTDEHDTSVKDLDEYKEKLLQSGLFKATEEHNEGTHEDTHEHHESKHHGHHDDGECSHGHKSHNHRHKKMNIECDLDALTKNLGAFKEFMNSLEQYLLFEYVEKLRYEQYGLNDYFQELDKYRSQWEREESTEHRINLDNVRFRKKGNIHHKHKHKHKHHDCPEHSHQHAKCAFS